MDQRVQAIRQNELVGNGTCTSIDECWEDRELVQALDENNITTPENAIQWAIELEGLIIENATNKRWGEDNDPEIARLHEWEHKIGN